MSGVELVAGVTAAFFAFGIMAGVLAVIALSAVRGHRMREEKRHRFVAQFQLFYAFKRGNTGIGGDDPVTIAIVAAQVALHRAQYVGVVVNSPDDRLWHNYSLWRQHHHAFIR